MNKAMTDVRSIFLSNSTLAIISENQRVALLGS